MGGSCVFSVMFKLMGILVFFCLIGNVQCCQVFECYCWVYCVVWIGVGVFYYWGIDIVCSVKVVDDVVVVLQSMFVDIGVDIVFGFQVVWNYFGVIIGWVVDFVEVWIGFVVWVVVVVIVGIFFVVVVFVDIGLGECVEMLDGGSEFVCGQIGFVGQFCKGIGLDDDVGIQLFVWNVLFWLQFCEDVVVLVLLVEYQLCWNVFVWFGFLVVFVVVYMMIGFDVWY